MSNTYEASALPSSGPDAQEALIWGGELAIIQASGRETNGRYCIIELFATQEGAPPWHVHQNEDEGFYVLEGAFTFYVGDKVYQGKAGDYFMAPKGIPHTYTVNSKGIAKVLMICSPAGFEDLVRAMSVPATSLVPPEPGSVAPDYEAMEQLAAQYGVSFVEPPVAMP